MKARFIQFLQDELAIPSESIAIALRHEEQNLQLSHLTMLLWKYGLISLKQIDLIFDWLETA
ncbi:MAG: DUF2949 domain-containing protein [Spirulinaceae cyanobacterium]|jgi:hypothetical protein